MPTHFPGRFRLDPATPGALSIELLGPATNTVYEGGRQASWLLLPVLGAAG